MGAKAIEIRSGAEALRREQNGQNDGRDPWIGRSRRRQLRAIAGRCETLHGREHRDGRGDHAVAVKEGRADDEHVNQPALLGRVGFGQSEERENATLAVVAKSQQKVNVLECDDEEQVPDDETCRGLDVKDIRLVLDRLLEGVDRRRTDVAKYHAQAAEGEPPDGGWGNRLVVHAGGAASKEHTVRALDAQGFPK